jgi:hypothetical protein
MAERSKLPTTCFFDADFRAAMADPINLIECIYAHFNIPMTATAHQQIQTYMDKNPRENRPSHNYTLEQFGLSEADIKMRFHEYRKRHLDSQS